MTNASWQNAFTEEGINGSTFAVTSATKEDNLEFQMTHKIHKYLIIFTGSLVKSFVDGTADCFDKKRT